PVGYKTFLENTVWAWHPERPKGAKDLLRAVATNHSMEILRRFSRFASFAPQNDRVLEMTIKPGKEILK
ncbi:MAG TPA: hypothetical protein VGD99_10750, partial [Anaerolineae bacterium]